MKTVERGKAVPNWIGWVFGILRKLCVMDKGCFSVAPVCYWIARSGPTNLLDAFVFRITDRQPLIPNSVTSPTIFSHCFACASHVWRSKFMPQGTLLLYGNVCVCMCECVFVAEKWERSFYLDGKEASERARFIFNVDYKWTFLASLCCESPLRYGWFGLWRAKDTGLWPRLWYVTDTFMY